MNRCWSLALLAVSVACSEEGGPTGPVEPLPESVPVVEQSIGFGDPPVSGLISFSPASDGTTGWRYSIEIDGSGTTAKEGAVVPGPAMTFRFEEPGVHELSIHLERGNQRATVTKRVIVNDPSAVTIVNERLVVPLTDDIEGIAYLSSTEDHLFVSYTDGNKILRIDPTTLLVEAELVLPDSFGKPLGLALDEDRDELYALSSRHYLSVVSVSHMELLASPIPLAAQQVVAEWQVELLESNLLAMGGFSGVMIFDTESGQVVRERVIADAYQFSVSPDRSTIAVIQYLDDRTAIWLLDAGTLTEQGVVTLPQRFRPQGASVGFKPDGSRAYVLGTDGEELHFT